VLRSNSIFIPATIFAAASYMTSAQNAKSEAQREFQLTAQKFEFSPQTIEVKRGDRVKLTVTAVDSQHGFKLEAFHVEQKLPKGHAVTVEFTADQAGTFSFQCSHFCGMGHSKMKGKLIVE
jgi:cytochrome c oxidase subunit II